MGLDAGAGWDQTAVLAWVRERWPDYCDPVWRAMKIGEEAGEVLGAVVKSQEGVGGKTIDDVAKETAQLVMCAYGLAEAAGFDLDEYLDAEWADMQTRVWPGDRPDGTEPISPTGQPGPGVSGGDITRMAGVDENGDLGPESPVRR